MDNDVSLAIKSWPKSHSETEEQLHFAFLPRRSFSEEAMTNCFFVFDASSGQVGVRILAPRQDGRMSKQVDATAAAAAAADFKRR